MSVLVLKLIFFNGLMALIFKIAHFLEEQNMRLHQE